MYDAIDVTSGIFADPSHVKYSPIAFTNDGSQIWGNAEPVGNQYGNSSYWSYHLTTRQLSIAPGLSISCFSDNGNPVGRRVENGVHPGPFCEFISGEFITSPKAQKLLEYQKGVPNAEAVIEIAEDDTLWGCFKIGPALSTPWQLTNDDNAPQFLSKPASFATTVYFHHKDSRRLWGHSRDNHIYYWEPMRRRGQYEENIIKSFGKKSATFHNLMRISKDNFIVIVKCENQKTPDGIAVLNMSTQQFSNPIYVSNDTAISHILSADITHGLVLATTPKDKKHLRSFSWWSWAGTQIPLLDKLGEIKGLTKKQLEQGILCDIHPDGRILFTHGVNDKRKIFLLQPT